MSLTPSGGFDTAYDESYFILQIRGFDTAGGVDDVHGAPSSDGSQMYYLSSELAHLFDMASPFFSEAVQTDPDTFSRAFKMGLKEFTREARDFIKSNRYESSKFENEFLNRFSEIRADLIRLNEELRQQNAPHDKRIKTLRERYLEWMERFNHFGPIYDGVAEYDVEFRQYGTNSTLLVYKSTSRSGIWIGNIHWNKA